MVDILELMGGILRKLDETVAKFDLCQLKQHESVDEYFNSFDLITSKFHLSEEFKVKWFVKGLKEDISLIVNYFEPSSLQRALELAKLQEQALEMMRSMYKERIEAENVQEDELKEKEDDRGGCEFFEKQIDQVFGEDVDDDLNPKEISTFGSIFHSASISMDPEGTLEKNNYTRPNEEMEANVIRVQDVIDKNELRGMSVDEIILSQSDQFDFQEATSIANTDINKYRNFLTTEGNNDMYISSMAPEIYMVDEVFDALIPEIDVFLMNSRLVPGFLDKLSLRNGEESEILFEYKEVSSKDIEKQLIKRGFKVSNFQVDEFKKLSGVVEIMNRRMLINIKLFSNASDIFVGCASKVSKQRGNIPWVIPAHYLIYNSSDDPSLRKVEGVMEVDVLKMEQPKYIPGGMTFKDKNKLQYNQALEDNFFIGKWNQVQVPLSEIPTKQSSKRHLHNSVEVHLIFILKDGKNGSQGIYKALGKIILIIWGWFYKESEDLFKKLIENLRIELYQRSQFYLHPGCWNIQWAIAWNSEWKIKNWEEWLCVLEDLLHWFQFCAKAVIEKVPLKQSIFSEIEKACPPHCILATNTSTIDLNIVGEKTRSQDRIIGAHFFSPAHVMPLLEIVRTEKTSPQVIIDLMTVGKAIKKVPVIAGNCTGFAVNRTFFPYTQGSEFLVHLGVDVFRIDTAISDFGMPMGPFQLADVSGYGVALAVKPIYAAAFKGRVFKSDLMQLMVDNGRQGKANGKGFYSFEKGSKPMPDPSVQTIIQESRRRANIMPNGEPISLSDEDILEMVFFPVVNEACRVIAEGVVVRASDLDIASVLGMGFPKYRGGLLFWADTVGSGYIYSKLNKWADTYGGFFKPSPYLEERAKKNLPLSMTGSSQSDASRARL